MPSAKPAAAARYPEVPYEPQLIDATFAERVFFCNSGAEAIEGGIRYDEGNVHRDGIMRLATARDVRRRSGRVGLGGRSRIHDSS